MLAFNLNPTSKALRFHMHSGLHSVTVPGTAEHRARLQALRTVALFEFAKGLLVLLAAVSRLAEAYGLWRARPWGEWIALVSGAVYLPFEIYKVASRVTILHVTILLINLAIVAFMFYLRIYLPRVKPVLRRIS